MFAGDMLCDVKAHISSKIIVSASVICQILVHAKRSIFPRIHMHITSPIIFLISFESNNQAKAAKTKKNANICPLCTLLYKQCLKTESVLRPLRVLLLSIPIFLVRSSTVHGYGNSAYLTDRMQICRILGETIIKTKYREPAGPKTKSKIGKEQRACGAEKEREINELYVRGKKWVEKQGLTRRSHRWTRSRLQRQQQQQQHTHKSFVSTLLDR